MDGTDENLFKLVHGQGARTLCLALVPVSWHGAQICAWAPTKRYVQSCARAWAPGRSGILSKDAKSMNS